MNRVFLSTVFGLLLVSCERKVLESVTPTAGSESVEESAAVSSYKEYILVKAGVAHLAGKSLDMISKEHIYHAKMQIISQGQTIPGDMDTATSNRKWRQILSENKIRETLLVDKKRESVGFGGKLEPSGNYQPSPLLNFPVIYEKSEGQWEAKLEDKSKLTDKVQERLQKLTELMNRDEDFRLYGTIPRRVGDEWEVDANSVDQGNFESGVMQLRLLRVEQFEGLECAVLSADFRIKGKRNEEKFSMNMDVKGTIKRSLKYCVNLESKLDGTVVIYGAPQEGVTIKGEGKMSIDETIKVVEPRPVQ